MSFLVLPGGGNLHHETFILNNDIEGNCISVEGYSDKDTLLAPPVLKNNWI